MKTSCFAPILVLVAFCLFGEQTVFDRLSGMDELGFTEKLNYLLDGEDEVVLPVDLDLGINMKIVRMDDEAMTLFVNSPKVDKDYPHYMVYFLDKQGKEGVTIRCNFQRDVDDHQTLEGAIYVDLLEATEEVSGSQWLRALQRLPRALRPVEISLKDAASVKNPFGEHPDDAWQGFSLRHLRLFSSRKQTSWYESQGCFAVTTDENGIGINLRYQKAKKIIRDLSVADLAESVATASLYLDASIEDMTEYREYAEELLSVLGQCAEFGRDKPLNHTLDKVRRSNFELYAKAHFLIAEPDDNLPQLMALAILLTDSDPDLRSLAAQSIIWMDETEGYLAPEYQLAVRYLMTRDIITTDEETEERLSELYAQLSETTVGGRRIDLLEKTLSLEFPEKPMDPFLTQTLESASVPPPLKSLVNWTEAAAATYEAGDFCLIPSWDNSGEW